MFDIAHLSKFVVNFNLLILSKPKCIVISTDLFSSPEHEVLMVSYCDQSLIRPFYQNCSKNSATLNKMAARAINRNMLLTTYSAKSVDRF